MEDLFEFAIVAIIILVLYHAFVLWNLFRGSHGKFLGTSDELNLVWASYCFRTGNETLAVQTIRSATTIMNGMAETCVTMVVPFALLSTLGGFSQSFKYFLIIGGLVIAFFNFTLCCRYLAHINFMFVFPRTDDSTVDPLIKSASGPVNLFIVTYKRSLIHSFIAYRFIFIIMPISIWRFGNISFFIATLVTVFYFYYLDFYIDEDAEVADDEIHKAATILSA